MIRPRAGLPLQVTWAVLDLLTIIVLGSGLYLWLARRSRRNETRWYGLFRGRLRKGGLDIIDRDPTTALAVDTDSPCGEPRQ